MIDKQIIYDLAQRIKFVGTIGCQKRILPQHDIYKISLCGPVAQEINKYGYSPGPKTRKEFIPDCITGENLRHFVRGLWDGDGMMHLRKNTKHPLRTGVCCANKDLLVDLHTRLKSLNIVKGGTLFKQHANAIFYLCFGHMDSLLLCEWMYKDATIKLNRKYDEYIKGNAAGKIIAQKDNLCSFPGCKHPCIAKNMCDYHYHIPISRASYLRNKDVIRERRRLNKDHVNYLARLRYAKRYEELRA